MMRILRLACGVCLASLLFSFGLAVKAANTSELRAGVFDPPREQLKTFLASFDPSFVVGTGTPEQLAAVCKAYGITLSDKIFVETLPKSTYFLFGPALIMPDQSFRLPFRKASTYLFACPLHMSGLLTIVVEPEPELGWMRLRWRTSAAAQLAAAL